MTSLAIIGSGIAGRSLVYTLAKEKKSLEKIVLFSSDSFAFPCSLHSTAVVAPRGLTKGHSALGDLLMEGFSVMKEHVETDHPQGIQRIPQLEASSETLSAFQDRYPQAEFTKSTEGPCFTQELLVQRDEAYLIDPPIYLDWLLREAQSYWGSRLHLVSDFVMKVEEGEGLQLTTQDGKEFSFDQVVFAGGAANRFWDLKRSKVVQGSFLEWTNLDWERPSFSLTLDGENLIWNTVTKRLLMGSTSREVNHTLPPMEDLGRLYRHFTEALSLSLPDFSEAKVLVGLREKAKQRRPYLEGEKGKIFLGGLYKNGFTLGLKMARMTSRQFL